MRTESILRLLIAEASLNDAERLISVLRNVGYAVRPTRVDGVEALQGALAGQPQDLLVCAPGLEALPINAALRTIHQSGHDVGVIALAETEDAELRREVMAMGIADLVSKADGDHFRYVVEREHAALQSRRSQRRLEAALRESERRCEALLESSRDAIAYIHDGMHIFANRAYVERFGLSEREEIEGLPLLDLIAPAEQSRFRDLFRDYSRSEEPSAELRTRIRTADGTEQEVVVTLTEGSWDGEAATQILIREHEEAELAERLESLSRQDMLTGLLNRNHFLARLGQILTTGTEEDAGAQHALLYLRLDHVEAIQQNLGIGAVDQAVADTAALLEDHVPATALCARYGDTTFVALLPSADIHGVLAVAESVRHAVENAPSRSGGHTLDKTVSIGVAMVGDNAGTAEHAVNLAAEASEQAARAGGNRVHLQQGHPDEDGEEAAIDPRTRIGTALSDAMVERLYQPIVALRDAGGPAYELISRLRDDYGTLEDDTLRRQARQAELLPELDRYLLTGALTDATGGEPPRLFVTLAGETLAGSNPAEWITQAMQSTGLRSAPLVIQIPESAAVTQLGRIEQLAAKLSGLGAALCLIGFGSGLDSFRLLNALPIGYVRLDETLLSELDADEATARHVGELIGNAHEHGCRVIAGGLAEARQLARLWRLDVDLVQGSFLREPAPEMDYDFSALVM
ncbi:EAL domain-containing protein [Arhodomonas sp. SL1]|uniref:EAL domain-containing response regulator n=1 Tax=Arhodomonas sp. SL1 TaxID=3425691 RepID=UPI003F882EF2